MNPRLEKVLKLPAYQRILILVGIMLLIAGLFVYLVYLPMGEEYSQLQERNRTLEAKLQEDRRIANNLPKFRAEYEKMKEQLDAALSELPNEKEIPTLLTSIASLAKENGLDVLKFQPNSEVSKGFYAEVPVTLRLAGSYHEVGLFSDAISRLPRIVNLNNLSLSTPKSEDGRTQLSVDVLATTFRFIEGSTSK
ncbi:type IV pilus assembly protein PilO [Desulfuromonas versatilis]|uniref:Type IV pilus assembly protein PilO n=1 Tax=Desulfuromonas versatilis TaxID=2802975 RepID=A0ABM8HP40_9BACT|nr:type 4a pilus biogenesis protein PilO [Desulfuromonas versatilis]BCR04681.1 type IV pilus assembly protein PilO [Desulfuromonas versatilis]